MISDNLRQLITERQQLIQQLNRLPVHEREAVLVNELYPLHNYIEELLSYEAIQIRRTTRQTQRMIP